MRRMICGRGIVSTRSANGRMKYRACWVRNLPLWNFVSTQSRSTIAFERSPDYSSGHNNAVRVSGSGLTARTRITERAVHPATMVGHHAVDAALPNVGSDRRSDRAHIFAGPS